MKKLLTLVSALVLVFTSCSNDDDSSSSSSTPVLLTKTVETDTDGFTYTTNYEYIGTKLNKIVDDEGYFTFIYENDLITEVKYYESSTLLQTETYVYDSNDRVIEYVIVDNIDTSWGNKETYVYNPDGSISVSYYIGDAFSQTTLNKTGTINFVNGEVSQISFSDGRTRSYTYDNKNNPFINVIGLDKISFCNQEASGILHNVTEEDDSADMDDLIASYTYNSNDFPVTSIETDFEVINVQYFYNQ